MCCLSNCCTTILQASERLLLRFLTAKLTLAWIFKLAKSSEHVRLWRSRFAQRCIDWQQLEFHTFAESKFLVYVCFFFEPSRRPFRFSRTFYIGSTEKGILHRSESRLRKARQVENEKIVKAELSIHYWVKQSLMHCLCTLPVHFGSSAEEVRELELLLIAKWQPHLNYPLSRQFLIRPSGVKRCKVPVRHGHQMIGTRIHKKLRRLAKPGFLPIKATLDASCELRAAWKVIIDLSSNTLRSFETAKLLRSYRFSSEQLFAILKLSANLEQPFHRAAVRKELHRIFRFRNLVVPKNKSLFASSSTCS